VTCIKFRLPFSFPFPFCLQDEYENVDDYDDDDDDDEDESWVKSKQQHLNVDSFAHSLFCSKWIQSTCDVNKIKLLLLLLFVFVCKTSTQLNGTCPYLTLLLVLFSFLFFFLLFNCSLHTFQIFMKPFECHIKRSSMQDKDSMLKRIQTF